MCISFDVVLDVACAYTPRGEGLVSTDMWPGYLNRLLSAGILPHAMLVIVFTLGLLLFSNHVLRLRPFRDTKRVHRGGGRVAVSRTTFEQLATIGTITTYGMDGPISNSDVFQYVSSVTGDLVDELASGFGACISVAMPLPAATRYMPAYELGRVAILHSVPKIKPTPALEAALANHMCTSTCPELFYVFKCVVQKPRVRKAKIEQPKPISLPSYQVVLDKRCTDAQTLKPFPPKPLTVKKKIEIIHDFCKDLHPSKIEESGCTVCGQLTLKSDLTPLHQDLDLSLLVNPGVRRTERSTEDDPICFPETPVRDDTCSDICRPCRDSLKSGKRPRYALANYMWLGNVPQELSELSFAEKILIARVRHNRCLVKVASGRARMTANAIMFASPVVKVYHALPPPKSELEDVLAFIFIGSQFPTEEDFKRTPMLVRREKVAAALEWLKLNHQDYADLFISKENLDMYPLSGVPVTVDFRRSDPGVDPTDKEPLEQSKHEEDTTQGTEEGPCPFVVRGLTSNEYADIDLKKLKAVALNHLDAKGKTLGVGHDPAPQSMYDNVQAYPQMFPWLFPYGLGGIGHHKHSKIMSEREHKRRLLMYHDKRFQLDLYFPMIAFNHEQLKSNITASFLYARRGNFPHVSSKLATSLSNGMVASMAELLEHGDIPKLETPEERDCYSLLDDIDHVGARTDGFLTSKKFMRNEIWSLVAEKGAPNWFITFAPADGKHPLCIYYAGTEVEFRHDMILPVDVRNTLIARNPVAAARFFDVLVRLVLKHVFGVKKEDGGIYGKPAAYYGTVEQQGRLTLHLHIMLWIEGAFSPQAIRDRLKSQDAEFTRDFIAYLESCHQGECLTGPLEEVKMSVPRTRRNGTEVQDHPDTDNENRVKPPPGYKDPTLTLPEPPPTPPCNNAEECSEECENCRVHLEWWKVFLRVTDDLLVRSNEHKCRDMYSGGPKGCLDKDGLCRARFPREVVRETIVDLEDGHVTMKHLEARMNTVTPVLTYLLRCNTDVTSMLSGTTLKAVIKYVTDYITKASLKSHHIFSTANDVYQKNIDLINDSDDSRDAGRRMLLKITNALMAKMEIGSPMASLYLLGNPDHYTSHRFTPFFWKKYVTKVKADWALSAEDATYKDAIQNYQNEKVLLEIQDGEVKSRSLVDDYTHRPKVYEEVPLYDWMLYVKKRRIPGKKKIKKELPNESSEDDMDDDSVFEGQQRYMRFLEGHPQYTSHEVYCDFTQTELPVLNWLGGVMPRRDQGDREYYCLVMLTLFKPWRSGLDLKDVSQLWDDAFAEYKFQPHFLKVMDNLNLRYECLDAKDDFFAQLKKQRNALKNTLPYFQGDGGNYEELEEYDDAYLDALAADVDEHGHMQDGYMLGYRRKTKLIEMDQAEDMISRTGWLEGLGVGSDSSKVRGHGSIEDIKINQVTNESDGSHWKAIVKDQRAQVLARKRKHAPAVPQNKRGKARWGVINDVCVLDASYLLQSFAIPKEETKKIIDDTVGEFSLNKEQERAFKIVANHAACLAPKQLLMYLGGMGGTGKSQVIKSLISMFEKKRESHRFIVLAPTGTAAALLNGSTYHSMLGVRASKSSDDALTRNEQVGVTEARERLRGVDYIFIDEISMVSCQDLCNISARLAEITSVKDEPFGGMNMILAGDFAQLPPTSGTALYRPTSTKKGVIDGKLGAQRAALGKFTWHQFTTVVILKQNMRQKTQSLEDAAFRTALENMRYGACTQEDLLFLRTRIARKGDPKTSLDQPRFRNVSIITSWNSYKDRYNELGCKGFSKSLGLPLVTFRSRDVLGYTDDGTESNVKRPRKRKGYSAKRMSQALQQLLWKLEPHTSQHIAGTLTLCLGMPVMLRHNDATELCMTKGQEGHVVGWTSSPGLYGSLCLETLYVRLSNPPQTIQIPGLPTNVVPIVKTKHKIKCQLPDDSEPLNVEREQVNVLPNFSMTDYASQGKTRKVNVVDLSCSKTCQAVYTSLSRSSSAADTIITQPFNTSKITSGIDGYLRQEFRELHILDKITELRFSGRLNPKVVGDLRYPILKAFRMLCGHELENIWPGALKEKDVKQVEESEDDLLWNNTLVESYIPRRKRKVTGKDETVSNGEATRTTSDDLEISEKGAAGNDVRTVYHPPTSPAVAPPGSMCSLKRPSANDSHETRRKSKRVRTNSRQEQEGEDPLLKGFIWDAQNYSCAYDSLFTILYNAWAKKDEVWAARISAISTYMSRLVTVFESIENSKMSFEKARDDVRDMLHQAHPEDFPMGPNMTAIQTLIQKLCSPGSDRNYGTLIQSCSSCSFSQQDPAFSFNLINSFYTNLRYEDEQNNDGIALSQALFCERRSLHSSCPACTPNDMLTTRLLASDSPPLVFFEIAEVNLSKIELIIRLPASKGFHEIDLIGIIYHSETRGHFLCRMLDSEGRVWYHDGMTTGRTCSYEFYMGLENESTESLLKGPEDFKPVFAVYCGR